MNATQRPIGYRGKRLFDIVVATVALVFCGPLMAIAALIVALRMGRPVIFVQERPGFDKTPFPTYKFRSMTQTCDITGKLLPDAERLTKLGRFLRASSLDELPGLFNVLKGDMSLVGPRPLLTRYLPHYTEHEMLRFEVRPGITGWAQINGRNDLPWDDRLACDVWYVEHCSFALDLHILWLTLFKVMQRVNVQVETSIEGDLSVERTPHEVNALA